jgi:rhodanese-related sulfurtransferase
LSAAKTALGPWIGIYFIMRAFSSTIGSTVKFILDHIFLIGIAVLSGGALLWPVLTQRGKKASALEVTQLINRGKATIVDIRDAEAFAAGHLRDARNIPLKDLKGRVGELDKLKNRTAVVVCQTGARAFGAAKILEGAGFTDVVVLDGGIAAWQTQGLPTTK